MYCCTSVDRSVEYRFNRPLQQQCLFSVYDRYFSDEAIIRMAEIGLEGLNGISSLVYCSSYPLTILNMATVFRF